MLQEKYEVLDYRNLTTENGRLILKDYAIKIQFCAQQLFLDIYSRFMNNWKSLTETQQGRKLGYQLNRSLFK